MENAEILPDWLKLCSSGGIGDDNLYKIVGYCDYGVIGHPIWKILADMRMSGGRIHQPLAFIWSRLRV